MKITVIHGEDTNTSYSTLVNLKESIRKKGWTITKQFGSNDLFDRKQVYFCDDIAKVKKGDLDVDGFMIIYSDHELTPNQLKILPRDAKIQKFDLPKIIFNFLDSFYPGNSKKILNLLHQLVERESVELVFAILVKHVRDLYWVKVDEAGLPYPDWRVLKIMKQADKFTIEKLQETINVLSEIDIKTKTTGEKLGTLLDFTILTNLQ